MSRSPATGRRPILKMLGWLTGALVAIPLDRLLVSAIRPAAAQTFPIQLKGTHMTHDSSAEVDPYRLPRHVVPTRYELRLEPDLAKATFQGTERIALQIAQPTHTIVLNAVDLTIAQAAIHEGLGRQEQTATVDLEPDLQRCRLTFDPIIPPGEWWLSLSFGGILNDKLRGFYRSTYKDPRGVSHTIAATQFEATDARRAFPCWDEPDFKAVFSTTLVVDRNVTALSNSSVLSKTAQGDKTVVRFADTMKMSTYLVAFVVGPLEGSAPTLIGATSLRLWAVPGKQSLMSFGQDIAAASLRFFESYYGIPYPGDKLDLIALPDFASGAMENLGAITFRETALLVDQHRGTHGELERVADVVAHENAHMWFGDLVTMSWWNGLWLNEAFATFMEMLAVDAWKPEWKRWDTFSVSRAAAFAVDGLHSTRPIEFPVRAPKDAEAMFDVLTYEKGASVLRMLEQYIGPAVFRDGVRDYLKTHAYGNADTKDLWISLGKAASQPVPELMDGWIFQEGYPLVSAELADNGELTLTQQRFTYLPSSASQAKGLQPSWHVPVQIRLRAGAMSGTRRVLLVDRSTRVTVPSETESLVVNEGGHGFFRVRYGPSLFARLLDGGLNHLAAIERFNVLNDAWATTVAGLFPLSDYLALTGRFTSERDKNVWAVMIDSFSFLNRIIETSDRPALETFVRHRLGPAVSEIGWTPHADENDLTRQLRSELVGALGRLGNDSSAQTKAEELYGQSRREADSVDPNLVPALVSILAFTGDAARYEEFTERFKTAATPQEERRYLFALTAFRHPSLLEQTLAKTLNGEIRVQDAPFIVSAVMGNVYGRHLGWNFVKANWDLMDRQFPKQGLRRLCGGITGLATPELEEDVRTFFSSRHIDLGGRTLEQYLEQLRIVVTFRQTQSAALPGYLQAAWK
ncbi:putative Peptidase M1, membrane alanine aminopeptidase [Nitrospira sp. KM1]|uniref:M1 family metallopeptidase n=1 Tax=Nitrospira sp. KM1 TaxID=1936990 RepID=UPI0013A7146F|nr:M1 family metallopeptidase [Nitrospira sp. KM1]BCA55471.1 putative Peptidase M1, membrane alanine aminopeptidase [Nitrospira sp. KM1]